MGDAERCFELLQTGNENGILDLLDQNPSLANTRDAGGVSLLMHALYRGRRDLAETIAAKKEELDVFEAASLGRIERLKELIHDPRTVASYSNDGFTALHFACYFGQPEAIRILLKAAAKTDAVARNPMQVMPLHSAASARNLEGVRLLLQHGAPVNARQQGGWTPIHASAQNGDRAMVELLLQHGADRSAANDQGQTPATVARAKGQVAIAELMEQ
jgi:ankyrin repeat protein